MKQKSGWFAPLLVVCVGSTTPLGGAATPCIYQGLDADTRVINRSGEITSPFPDSLSAHDCQRLKVATGTVRVYAENADGKVLPARQVNNGPLVALATDAAAFNPQVLGILQQFIVVLEATNRAKNGSSRGTEGDSLVNALPAGRLAQPLSDLIITLGPIADINLVFFELSNNGKVVHRQSGASRFIKLPAAQLKAGAKISWRLEYTGSKYAGTFTVEPTSDLDSLQQALIKETEGEADAFLVKLRVAAGLNKERYLWDARELIRSALIQ
jgi:hypothetical protein